MMQIICPSCASTYEIPDRAIGEDGKKVRCAICQHQWLQMPVITESFQQEPLEPEEDYNEEDAEEDFSLPPPEDDTLEAPMDLPDSINPQKMPELPPPNNNKAQWMGTGVAACFVLFLLGLIVVMKNDIVTRWAPASYLYDLVGMPVMMKGKGLVFESLSATETKTGDNKAALILKGRVANLLDQDVAVPILQASLRTTNGESAQSWVIDPPVKIMKAGESFTFSSDYPDLPRGIGAVNITFLPKVSRE